MNNNLNKKALLKVVDSIFMKYVMTLPVYKPQVVLATHSILTMTSVTIYISFK